MVQESKNFIVPRKNKMKILYMVENQIRTIVPRKNKIKIPYMVENQKDFIVLWKKSFRGGIKVWQSKILYSDQTTIYSNPFEKYIKK